MLLKSLLATCCVALLPALIGAGPIVPPTTTSNPVDTYILAHSTSHANPLLYSIGYFNFRTAMVNPLSGGNVAPEYIDASAYTHIIITDACVIKSFELGSVEKEDEKYSELDFDVKESKSLELGFNEEKDKEYFQKLVNNVKKQNPHVKVIISFGSFSFYNDDYMTMDVAVEKNQRGLIKSASNFFRLYNVDGINLDWAFDSFCPSSDDCGGHSSVANNFVRLVEEMRKEFKDQNSISIGIPLFGSYNAKGLNVELMAPHLDFITIFGFGIHGPWSDEKNIGMRYHADMHDVTNGLNLLLSNKNIPKNKLLLGLSFWSVAYKLADPQNRPIGDSYCNPDKSEPNASICTGVTGIWTYKEIKRLKDQHNADNPRIHAECYDDSSFSKVMVFDTNQRVAYDDPGTFSKRIEYARKTRLGGISAVFINQDDSEGSMSKAIKKHFSRN